MDKLLDETIQDLLKAIDKQQDIICKFIDLQMWLGQRVSFSTEQDEKLFGAILVDLKKVREKYGKD